MGQLRLKTLASFIKKKDKVVDIGCDHAYLSIYLIKNNLCKSVIASDINSNALNNAKQNIKKEKLEKEIPTILSDGLENINQSKVDTIVVSGMGTATIVHILEKVEIDKIKKIILQSNNDLYSLRKKMQEFGYYLAQEKVVFEKKHYYVIGEYTKEPRKLKKRELIFGIYYFENKKYYQYLKQEFYKINKKIPFTRIKEKMHILWKMHLLKKYL